MRRPEPPISLQEHKAKVVELERRVAKVKTRYSVALRNLEQISEQIHAQRGRVPAGRARPVSCGARSSPVGAEAAEVRAAGAPGGGGVGGGGGGGGLGAGALESAWADGEKTRQWVERHRKFGWGQRDAAGDAASVASLQTIASDLEKCDSVGHLGDLSDPGSLVSEEGDREGDLHGQKMSHDRERDAGGQPKSLEVAADTVGAGTALSGTALSGTSLLAPDRVTHTSGALSRKRHESFVKQHNRSVSL